VRGSYSEGLISFEIEHGPALSLPASATTFEGFCDWAESDAVPELGRFSFLNGEVFIDVSPEEGETHNKVKEAVIRALGNLNEELDLGELYTDGMSLSNPGVAINTVPDALFISYATSRGGRARTIRRRRAAEQYTRIEGAPDWVLEILSQSSVEKDTRILRQDYRRAAIPEYWLIDARGHDIDFQMLVLRGNRYLRVPLRKGWYGSPVFGRGFRLERRRNQVGRWRYKLHVSSA
jgi:Uma2 family endonuclease